MSTPVIIPAFNEAARIGQALSHLPKDTYPIVAVNGSTDTTAEIAEDFGAAVQIFEEQGKMPAIQGALRSLGKNALKPVIILDADTRPLFPGMWRNAFVTLLERQEKPSVVGGPIIYTGRPYSEAILRTFFRVGRAAAFNKDETIERSVQFGPNMAIKLTTEETLNAVLELPNYWPSEDRAIAQAVLDNEGVYHGSVNPALLTTTPTSISAISLADRLHLGADKTRQVVEQRYIDRGAPASVPYEPTS